MTRAPLLLSLSILAAALLSLAVGPAPLGLKAVLGGLLDGAGTAGIIVREIRAPRTVLALLIGAILGASGAVLQGLMRNPLAEPALFGAPQTAAAAAAATIATGIVGTLSWALPVAAIAGAGLSVSLVVLVAGRRAPSAVLLLAGLAIGSLAAALTALALNLAPNPFAALEIAFWLMGSLEDRSWAHVALLAPFVGLAALIFARLTPRLRAFALGETVAESLGVNVVATRRAAVVAVALGVGASVAVAGAIGFVGLVAAHLVRGSVAHDPARAVPRAALAGALLLLLADILVRLVPATSEIKTGVATALIGAPFFIALVLSRRGRLGAAA